jgi:Tol biopolymer transport system component
MQIANLKSRSISFAANEKKVALNRLRQILKPLIVIALACLIGVPLAADARGKLEADHPYAVPKRLNEARIFGEGVISTQDLDDYFTFTPDGRTIYFTKHSLNFAFGTIVVSQFRNGRWNTPEVAAFSGQYNDREPALSPDGTKLFFASNRPLQGTKPKDVDIWVVERSATGWGTPRNLGAPVNSAVYDWHPSVAADGTLYFASNRKAAKERNNIYRARLVNGQYGEPELLDGAINSSHDDMHPSISPDGRMLLFVSQGRPDGFGEDDLYVSYWRNGAWTKARNLGPRINTKYYEYSARVSPDGRYLFFCRGFGNLQRPNKRLNYRQLMRLLNSPRNGLAAIYQIDLRAAGIEP